MFLMRSGLRSRASAPKSTAPLEEPAEVLNASARTHF